MGQEMGGWAAAAPVAESLFCAEADWALGFWGGIGNGIRYPRLGPGDGGLYSWGTATTNNGCVRYQPATPTRMEALAELCWLRTRASLSLVPRHCQAGKRM